MPTNFSIPLLYEDRDVFVFNKPAGLSVQGGKSVRNSLDELLRAHFQDRPLLVHRLDKETSGAILVAKNKQAAADYSKKFENGQIEKYYTAICKESAALNKEGIINYDLFVQGAEKNALTFYKKTFSSSLSILDNNINYAVLELNLMTGRTHQIRRHLFLKGAPILCDDKYGDFSLNKQLWKIYRLKHLFLHSSRLVFPARGGLVNISAPMPEYFAMFFMQKENA